MRKEQTLYIKNPRARRLAKQVSKQMNASLTDAVISALERQLQSTANGLDLKTVDEICAQARAIPDRDKRSNDEILGYNEFGIPS